MLRPIVTPPIVTTRAIVIMPVVTRPCLALCTHCLLKRLITSSTKLDLLRPTVIMPVVTRPCLVLCTHCLLKRLITSSTKLDLLRFVNACACTYACAAQMCIHVYLYAINYIIKHMPATSTKHCAAAMPPPERLCDHSCGRLEHVLLPNHMFYD